MMETKFYHALTTAKQLRTERDKTVKSVTSALTLKRAGFDELQAHVAALKTSRAEAVEAGRVDDVIAIDSRLLRAQIALECANGQVAALLVAQEKAATAFRDAATAVDIEARAALNCEMLDLAASFNTAMDCALELGRKLQALARFNGLNVRMNEAPPTIPDEVTRALERLPTPNPLNVPLHILRAGGELSDAYAVRLRELIDEKPDDNSIDDAA